MSEDKARVSEIIEAYAKGYEDGSKAVKQTFVADGIVFEKMDEPQTCSFSDCDNFKNPDYTRCIECKRKQKGANNAL